MKKNKELALNVFNWFEHVQIVWVKDGSYLLNNPANLDWEEFRRESPIAEPVAEPIAETVKSK